MSYWFILLIVVFIVVLAPLAQSESPLSIHLAPHPLGIKAFVDSAGRQRIFHGTNVVVKGPPYFPQRSTFDADVSLTTHDLQTMRDNGMNVIRLGVMWPGWEPVKGQYNQTYIDAIKGIIDESASLGIYTLIDMHQDVLAERFCGEGIPDWAVVTDSLLKFPSPVQLKSYTDKDPDTGFPTRQDCNKHGWPNYYQSEAVGNAFGALYTNRNGIRDAWAAWWANVAITFKGHPAVLGLELMNEPYAGNTIKDPTLFIPEVADKKMLQPAYDALASEIRKVDNDVLIFFAAVTWDDYGVGFTKVPGGDIYQNRSVLAYHFYKPPQFGAAETTIAIRMKDARRLQSGLMLTETEGATNKFSSNDDFSTKAAAADASQQSWAFWEYKSFCRETNTTIHSKSQFAEWGACKTGYGGGLINPDGSYDATVMKSYARTYSIAVAGTIQQYSFNNVTGVFSLAYTPNPSITLPTEIYISEQHYYSRGPPSIGISPSGGATVTYQPGTNRVFVTATSPVPSVVTVSITPHV